MLQKMNIPAFLYLEHKGVLSIVAVTLVLGLLFLLAGLPKNTENVSGIAYVQVYDGGVAGNEPKLAVKLNSGGLVHVHVSSPGQVKVGSELCLYMIILSWGRQLMMNGTVWPVLLSVATSTLV
jgi:hypothetical protein